MRTLIGCGLIFFLMLTAGCSDNGGTKTGELDGIGEYAAAEIKIENLRHQETPDWEAIQQQYDIASPTVKKAGQGLDREIRTALKNCRKGQDVKVNSQVVAKVLQQATVVHIRSQYQELDKETGAGEKIAAFFEGIRPTLVRRDKGFFKKAHLEKRAADVIAKLAAGKADTVAAVRDLEDVLCQTYALSMLYEIHKIEAWRKTGCQDCDVKLTEAKLFYRVIQERIAKRSPKADEVIQNLLESSYDTMDADLLEVNLNYGLRMTIR